MPKWLRVERKPKQPVRSVLPASGEPCELVREQRRVEPGVQLFRRHVPVHREPQWVLGRNCANFAELRKYAHTCSSDISHDLLHVQHGLREPTNLHVPSGQLVQCREHVLYS
jgi:hypothetical protein